MRGSSLGMRLRWNVHVLPVVVPLTVLMAFMAVFVTTPALAEGYPSRPITVVAPAGPGSGWDLTARTVSQVLTETRLVPVAMPVENRAGGGGAVALSHVVQNRKGDPNTLIVFSPPLILIHLNKQTPFSYRDLTPLARLFNDYQIIGVRSDSRYKSLDELMAVLRQNPKGLVVGGASAPGSMDHLSFMMAAQQSGVDVRNVLYISFPGGSELNAALLGGSIDIVSTSVGDILGYIEAGSVRALAVTSPERLTDPRLSNVPTLKELGINATFEVWRGIFGPPGMPEEARTYMSNALAKMVQTPEWKEMLRRFNWHPGYLPGDQFKAYLDGQEKLMGNLLKEMGLLK
ncbi:tripartite tricarboxylate transporter substrate binding protein [Carboxydochorda subterranea]|uniref:Tripartite tricarboxylate transporter substrate binding protein n=1 Tax=Carboxydichorda subterranea TaxID=3109565 RepID=A0ABZ1BXR4_9FIRM|nr:tripartite tricarboxylate transporter substrate binding protein [Limnochorda sp. L945t]WRP17341.1 tripartite tricarboxylate transporter substrate binding protein [Limnochorda sp. L945t]